jgi:hypothetical protein
MNIDWNSLRSLAGYAPKFDQYGAPLAFFAAEAAHQAAPYVKAALKQGYTKLPVNPFTDYPFYRPRRSRYSSKRKMPTRRYRSTALRLKRRRGRSYTKRRRKRKRRRTRPFSNTQYKAIKRMITHGVSDPYKEKFIRSTYWTSSENLCEYHSIHIGDRSEINSMLSDAFKVIGQNTTGTQRIETLDLTNQDNDIPNMKVRFTKCFLKMRVKNNTSFGARLHLWKCKPRIPSKSAGPKELLIEGIDNEFGETAGTAYKELTYWPYHSTQFRRAYILYGHKTIDLPPGAEYMDIIRVPSFTWDSDFENDSQTAETQLMAYRPHRTRFFFARTEGVVSHAQTGAASGVGIGETSLDVVYERHYSFSRRDADRVVQYYNTNSLPSLTLATQFSTHDPGEETFVE